MRAEIEVFADSEEVPAEHCMRFGANKFYTVRIDGENFLRLETDRDDWNQCFNEYILWRGWFVLGTGEQVIAVNLKTLECKQYAVDFYFNGFREYGETLFVQSGTEVLAFGGDMELLWRREGLADDGAAVFAVKDGTVFVNCIFDPPDGDTVEIRLDILSGKTLP